MAARPVIQPFDSKRCLLASREPSLARTHSIVRNLTGFLEEAAGPKLPIPGFRYRITRNERAEPLYRRADFREFRLTISDTASYGSGAGEPRILRAVHCRVGPADLGRNSRLERVKISNAIKMPAMRPNVSRS